MAYAFLTTFDLEVAYAWKCPLRLSSWFYLLMRYPPLAYLLITTGLNSYTPNCTGVQRLATWMEGVGMVASYGFQITRTWAICNRNTFLGVVLLLVCTPSMAIEIYLARYQTCSDLWPHEVIVKNIQFASDLVFESLVAVVTVSRTWSLVSEQKSLNMARNSLPTLLFRNGLVYYCILVFMNVASIVSLDVPYTFGSALAWYMLVPFNRPIRWILLSQFIIEIRQRVDVRPPVAIDTPELFTSGSLHFARTAILSDFVEPEYDTRVLHASNEVELTTL